jgi:hypothetical protein
MEWVSSFFSHWLCEKKQSILFQHVHKKGFLFWAMEQWPLFAA